MTFFKKTKPVDDEAIAEPKNEWQVKLVWPEKLNKTPPCIEYCPIGTDIRGWIGTIAQRKKLNLSLEETYVKAWNTLVEANPMPAVLGRICAHTCESLCNRIEKEGAVSIHAMERFIGDWGLEHKLSLPKIDVPQERKESIGVIGSGPAGLSFAYQMARRGYTVTIYEQHELTGGMLRYGIPEYRLPRNILDEEIRRINDLGVKFLLNTRVGKDVKVTELKLRHDFIFVSIGASNPRSLNIPGEDGPGVLSGSNFMYRANQGHAIDLGCRVVVIGGGNTAIDSARAACRLGAKVTMLYRRTRKEMHAISEDVDDALIEGIDIRYLASPAAILRENNRITGIRVQKMELGSPDESGRCQPMALQNQSYEIDVDTIIAAVSQHPDWDDLDEINPTGVKLSADDNGILSNGLIAGGDVLGLGTVSRAIGQGRLSAEALHAKICGIELEKQDASLITANQMHTDYYSNKDAAETPARPSEEWLSKPNEEIYQNISEQQFLEEASRCLSCGSCFGCEHCWMFCNPGAYQRNDAVESGAYFSFNPDRCEGCGKCIEVCPCGFLVERDE